MLVLSRFENEAVMIGELVKVIVVEIRGNKVRLGFEAPREVPIHRREVWEAIERNLAEQARVEQESQRKKELYDGQ